MPLEVFDWHGVACVRARSDSLPQISAGTYKCPIFIDAERSAGTAHQAASLTDGEDGPAYFEATIHKPQVAHFELVELTRCSFPASGYAFRCRIHQQGYIPQK